MSRTARHLFLVAGFLLLPLRSVAAECSLEGVWIRNQGKNSDSLIIEILEAPKGHDRGLEIIIPVLLRDYLSHRKDLSLPPIGREAVGETSTSSRHRLKGKLLEDKNGLVYRGVLFKSDGTEMKFESHFNFPDAEGFQAFLMSLVENVSAGLGRKLPAKKILPFMNKTDSPQAYRLFAEGSLALGQMTAPALEQAAGKFQEAIRSDYNYVPAYLGLAEALAGLSALKKGLDETSRGPDLAKRAEVELTKSQLLNPPLTMMKEPWIQRLLSLKKKDVCP